MNWPIHRAILLVHQPKSIYKWEHNLQLTQDHICRQKVFLFAFVFWLLGDHRVEARVVDVSKVDFWYRVLVSDGCDRCDTWILLTVAHCCHDKQKSKLDRSIGLKLSLGALGLVLTQIQLLRLFKELFTQCVSHFTHPVKFPVEDAGVATEFPFELRFRVINLSIFAAFLLL